MSAVKLTGHHYTFMGFCAALNASLGFLDFLFKLPIYLDLVGTFLAASLMGWRGAVPTTIAGLFILGVITTPTAFAYMGTGIVLATVASWLRRFGYLKTWVITLIGGAFLGVIAAIISAPVTTFLFNGVSFGGTDALTVLFKATGHNLLSSVLIGGLSTDPVDKVCASVIAMILLKRMPDRIRKQVALNA